MALDKAIIGNFWQKIAGGITRSKAAPASSATASSTRGPIVLVVVFLILTVLLRAVDSATDPTVVVAMWRHESAQAAVRFLARLDSAR